MMSNIPHNDHHNRHDGDEGEPLVPEGVLRGIEDIAKGRTASKDDIEGVLKF